MTSAGSGNRDCSYFEKIILPSDDLCWFGKPRLLVLREDHLAVRHDIEDAVAALDQLGFELERVLDLGRQTGGLGKILSTAAVGD